MQIFSIISYKMYLKTLQLNLFLIMDFLSITGFQELMIRYKFRQLSDLHESVGIVVEIRVGTDFVSGF